MSFSNERPFTAARFLQPPLRPGRHAVLSLILPDKITGMGKTDRARHRFHRLVGIPQPLPGLEQPQTVQILVRGVPGFRLEAADQMRRGKIQPAAEFIQRYPAGIVLSKY